MREGVRLLIERSLINMPDAAVRSAGQTEAGDKKCDVYAHKAGSQHRCTIRCFSF